MTLLDLLNIETGASTDTLQRIIDTAPRRYKVYEIPKRSGGSRTIAHPSRPLKLLQRIILKSILDEIEPSPIATAYVKGRGIKYNASMHIHGRWILKLDFQNFFHSIVPSDWDRVVRREDHLRSFARDAAQFHNILFWGAGQKSATCLSIGAPTSPMVSNLVCRKLDEWMIETANRLEVVVSRYADDITVSSNTVSKLLKFEKALENAINRSKGLRLSLNAQKRGLYGPGERRMVTGLVITPDGRVSIGRDRKREILSLVHRFSLGQLNEENILRTRGLVSFANSVDESFLELTENKYGWETISRLLRHRVDGPDPAVVVDF